VQGFSLPAAAFPMHRIHEVKEPMFANVRGFQLARQNDARSVMAAERQRASRWQTIGGRQRF